MIPGEFELFDNRILTNETIRRVGEEAGIPVELAADGDVRTKKASTEYERRWNPSGFSEASLSETSLGPRGRGRIELRKAEVSTEEPVSRHGFWSASRSREIAASGWCDWPKGTRWMSWHREAMKDAGTCDKPRGVGNRAVILGFPNGATHPQGYFTLNA